MASDLVLKALAVTLAAIGSETKPESVQVIAAELAGYPEAAVLAALARCKLECRYRLSLADVIERLDDGHLGPDEAWELVPKDERATTVLTQEIMAAIPFDLIASGDLTAARMAFREAYRTGVAEARTRRKPPRWFASLGHDQEAREPALRKAVELGRLGEAHMLTLLPAPKDERPVGRVNLLVAKLRGQ